MTQNYETKTESEDGKAFAFVQIARKIQRRLRFANSDISHLLPIASTSFVMCLSPSKIMKENLHQH